MAEAHYADQEGHYLFGMILEYTSPLRNAVGRFGHKPTEMEGDAHVASV